MSTELPPSDPIEPTDLTLPDPPIEAADASTPKAASASFFSSLPIRDQIILLLLIVMPLVCYWRVGSFNFINYDDPRYIYTNPHLRDGLTADSIKYALTSVELDYWHPLATLSHAIDVSLFGMNPGGHHFVSLLIHTINGVLVWWLLRKLTGQTWPAAWVAAMFALHPMHIESVAWISERKDVLSTMFMLLTFLAYEHYTRQPSVQRYLLVTLGIFLGFAAKPMGVVVPPVLFLLDIWPLRRAVDGRSIGKCLLEKVPWLVLAVLMGLFTIFATHSSDTWRPLATLPLSFRLEMSVVSYARYLGKLVWPTHQSVFYPMPEAWSAAQVLLSTGLFVLLTAIAIWQVRVRPFLFVGWFWFVIVLLPTIGLMITGDASLAERYTYLSYVGVFIAIAWMGVSLPRAAWPVVAIAGAAIVVAAGVATQKHVTVWESSSTLMASAIENVPDNWTAHINYGVALSADGDQKGAGKQFAEALRLKPNLEIANIDWARWLLDNGRPNEAIPYIRQAQVQPEDVQYSTWLTLAARIMAYHGDHLRAIAAFKKALSIQPDLVEAHTFLAISQIAIGRIDDAEQTLQDSLLYDPTWPRTYYRLGLIAASRNKPQLAIEMFQKALTYDFKFGQAYFDYGVTLANLGEYGPAMQQMVNALSFLPEDDYFHRTNAEMTYGKLLEKTGKAVEAGEHYNTALVNARKAVADQPEDASTAYQLATTLRDVGQTQESKKQALRAFKLATSIRNLYYQSLIGHAFPELASDFMATTRAAATEPSATQPTTRAIAATTTAP